jgi:hypothetical protein
LDVSCRDSDDGAFPSYWDDSVLDVYLVSRADCICGELVVLLVAPGVCLLKLVEASHNSVERGTWPEVGEAAVVLPVASVQIQIDLAAGLVYHSCLP